MSYAFPVQIQDLIQEELATGLYASENDVLLEAMRLLRDRDEHLRQFKAQLQTRLKGLKRGEGIEMEDDEALRRFFDDVERRGMERYQAARNAS
jgi:Arc/MetJ-type ribon-helix-helix transcriptional regulator